MNAAAHWESIFKEKVKKYRSDMHAMPNAYLRRTRFVELLRQIAAEGDPEGRHIDMDALLLARLDDDEATEVFVACERWYS